MPLWEAEDCGAWHAALARYPEVIRAQGVARLEELDAWYRDTLPGQIAAREPASVTREELLRVTEWKMKRGVWRARNRGLVAGNEATAVEQASRDAFAAAPDPRRPVAVLSDLAGVGPATASAVLAAYRPDLYPFCDDLVAAQIPDLPPVAYTLPYYVRYAAALVARAAELRAICPHLAWTAQDAGQALWAAAGGKTGAAPSPTG